MTKSVLSIAILAFAPLIQAILSVSMYKSYERQLLAENAV